MEWAPIQRKQLEAILSEEIDTLRPELASVYAQYAVAPFEQPCLRSQNSEAERVFVVARNGNHLLYFDDVEEEFGVAIADVDGVIRNWGNYGPLIMAVIVLTTRRPSWDSVVSVPSIVLSRDKMC